MVIDATFKGGERQFSNFEGSKIVPLIPYGKGKRIFSRVHGSVTNNNGL
jgi:hypothetical protein